MAIAQIRPLARITGGSIGSYANGGFGGGSGNPFGTTPQPIATPLSLYQQASQAAPGIPGLTGQTASAIGQQESGQLSPSTIRLLEDRAAAYGVNSGMPGTTPGSLALNNLLDQMGLTSEGLTQQGIGNYSNFLGSLAGTQLAPETAADVGEWNSIVRSAPDPAAAAQYQQNLFQDYESQIQNLAGGGEQQGQWWESNPLMALGPGTRSTGPGTYITPYLGAG